MAFSVTQKLAVSKSYPGMVLEVPQGEEDTEVTYTATSINSFSPDGMCTINYTITISGETSVWIRQFEFKYSGTGNPVEEGESALLKSIPQ